MRRFVAHPFRTLLLFSIPILLCLGYFVRRPFILETPLRQAVDKFEANKPFSLEFERLEPSGLRGIALKDVSGTGIYQGRRLHFTFDSLEFAIWPDLSGDVAWEIDQLEFNSGKLELYMVGGGNEGRSDAKRLRGGAAGAQKPPETNERDSKAKSYLSGTLLGVALSSQARIEAHQVDLSGELQGFQFENIELDHLNVSNVGADVPALEGRGRIGKIPFDFDSGIDSQSKRLVYRVKTSETFRPVNLDAYIDLRSNSLRRIANFVPKPMAEWFQRDVKPRFGVGELQFCPSCEAGSRFELQTVDIYRDHLFAEIGAVSLYAKKPYRFIARNIEFEPWASTTLRRLDVRLRQKKDRVVAEAEFFQPETMIPFGADSTGNVAYGEGFYCHSKAYPAGKLSIEAWWNYLSGSLRAEMRANSFRTSFLWPYFGLADHLQGGHVSGRQSLEVDLNEPMVRGHTSLRTKDVGFRIPRISNQWLQLQSAFWSNDFELNLADDRLNVSNGYVALTKNDFANYQFSLNSSSNGWRLKGEAQTGWLNPNSLKESLPTPITSITEGTNFKGLFGFRSRIQLRSSGPEEMVFEVKPFGDVEALKKGNSSRVWSLASGGPPSFKISASYTNWIEPDDWVPYEKIPESIVESLVAGEDTGFFEHKGFNWNGIRQAIVANLKQNQIQRGGSTITQQLAKNLFLSSRRTLARKLKEIYYTWRLEEWLTKERILELYINVVQWGPFVVGIDRAADYYFDIDPDQLDWFQSALLVSMLPAPHDFGRALKQGRLLKSRVTKIEHILKNLHFIDSISTQKYRSLLERLWDFANSAGADPASRNR